MIKQDLDLVVRAVREAVRTLGWDKASSRLGISLLVVSAVFFAANFADKAWTSYQLGQEKQAQMAAIAALTSQNQQYEQQLTYANSRSFYRTEARKYGYVEPGDIQLNLSTYGLASSPAPVQSAQPTATPTEQPSLLRRLLQAIVPGL